MTAAAPVSGATVDGVNLDVLAAAIVACPGVAAMHGGSFGEVTSYLPGRRLPGITVDKAAITVGVVSRWGISRNNLVDQVVTACAPYVGARRVDLVIADIELPAAPSAAEPAAPPETGLADTPASAHLAASGLAPAPGSAQVSRSAVPTLLPVPSTSTVSSPRPPVPPDPTY